jgi:hypothetical protein
MTKRPKASEDRKASERVQGHRKKRKEAKAPKKPKHSKRVSCAPVRMIAKFRTGQGRHARTHETRPQDGWHGLECRTDGEQVTAMAQLAVLLREAAGRASISSA